MYRKYLVNILCLNKIFISWHKPFYELMRKKWEKENFWRFELRTLSEHIFYVVIVFMRCPLLYCSINATTYLAFRVAICSPWTRLPVFIMGMLAGMQQLRRANPDFQVIKVYFRPCSILSCNQIPVLYVLLYRAGQPIVFASPISDCSIDWGLDPIVRWFLEFASPIFDIQIVW